MVLPGAGVAFRFGRQAQSVACVAALSVVAVLFACAWRHTAPPRGHGAAVAAAFLPAGDFAAPAPSAADHLPASAGAARASFWVGLISLAMGVAVVRQACWLRVAHMGGRCGH